jgi:hypothetical protein
MWSKPYTGISAGKSSIKKWAIRGDALFFGQTGYAIANVNFEIFPSSLRGFP